MTNAYATDLELMDRLGMSVNDSRRGVLSDVVEASSRWIDRTVGHRFYAVPETRYYSFCPTSESWVARAYPPYLGGRMRLDIDDVLSITSLQTDNNGDGTFETTWTSPTDYWLGPRNAPANLKPYTTINRTLQGGRFYFPYYDQAVAVTGLFGYSELASRPPEIRELCLIVATYLAGVTIGSPMAAMSSDLVVTGVQSYTIGGELTVNRQSAADLLALYQLPEAARRIIRLFKTSFFA